MKISAVWTVLMFPLWAGQSLRLNGSQTVSNTSVAAQSINAPCRLEFQLTFTSNPAGGNPAHVNACDLFIQFAGNALLVYPSTDTGWGCCVNIPTTIFASNWLILRFQQIPLGAGGMLIWEAWDINGVRQFSHTETYTGTSGAHSNGANIGSSGSQDSSWGFFRLYTTTVPIGSTEPTFADHGDLLDWQFNNSLNDSSTHHYNASGVSPSNLCGAPPCYEPTLGQALVTAVIKTNPAPVWSNFQSWRAGSTVGLDGSSSVSMADSSSTPTLEWQILSGPSTPIWSSHTVTKPTLTGIVFGNYRVQLVATNANGGSATSIQDIGAVAYNDNGVVIPADPNATTIFGPQIAFGQNPWGYADERNLAAITLQIANNPYFASALWLTTGQGTINYPFGGVGYSIGTAGTNLCGSSSCNGTGISLSDTTISVTDASKLSLSSLPTIILIQANPGSFAPEAIRICSTSSLTGNATLGVCYDGRGISTSSPGSFSSVRAQGWSSGAAVGEYRIKGTGTLFATDPQRPLAPAGVPGPMGPITYSTGTAGKGVDSTHIVGSGTTWSSGNGVVAGYSIRIVATHGGGSSFVFWSTINTVTDATHLVIDRPLPSDMDAGTGFSYKITQNLYLSLEMSDSDGTYRALQNGVSCESETACFGLPGHDIGVFNTACCATETGLKYSYKLTLGAISPFGPNFYGTGLAAREFYYRSGYGPALTLANQIDENWTRDPEVCGGLCGGLVLNLGGGAIGGIIDKVLNGSTILNWSDLIGWPQTGVSFSTHGCNADDQRDSSYPLAWLALEDIFNQSSTWDAGLTAYAAREDNCRKRASAGYTGVQINSWATSSNFGTGQFNGAQITLTNGSTAVTPTVAHTLVSGMCAGVDDGTGTITVTGGTYKATVASGNVAAGGVRIWIVDTSTSPSTQQDFEYSGSGGAGSTITLAGAYPNSGTHTYTFMVEDNSQAGNYYSIGVDSNPTDDFNTNISLSHGWACHFVDSDHITLNRPWIAPIGSSGPYTNYHFAFDNVPPGFETQPFMMGIKGAAMNWAAKVLNPGIAASFAPLLPDVGNWVQAYGLDSNTLGTFYDRTTEACEPFLTANPSPTFQSLHGVGSNGTCGLSGLTPTTGGEFAERVNTVEGGNALLLYYLASPDTEHRSAVDTAYGAIFGYCPYTQGGGSTFFCDSHYVNTANELSSASLGAFKWTGFFFGMGGLFSENWPAMRVGGVPPPVPETINVTCNISSVANATKCRVNLTKPDGSTVSNTCTTSPCPVVADAREGDHLLQVQYLSASNQVLASGVPEPVRVN